MDCTGCAVCSEACPDDADAGLAVGSCGEGSLDDELVGPPIVEVQDHEAGEDARPRTLRMIGGKVEVHQVLAFAVECPHPVPSSNLGSAEGEVGDDGGAQWDP